MTLKITLKPREKMIIGGAVLINSNPKNTDLIIENTVPVLRQRIYFVIQLMYIDEANLLTHHNAYWKLVRELLDAAPSLTDFIDQINQHILSGRYYQALKLARELITYEQEVISRVH
jgi:flagellar protein FlbT